MAFLIPLRTNKRILSIEPESGMEIFEDLTGADTSHLELLDPAKKAEDEGQKTTGGSKQVCSGGRACIRVSDYHATLMHACVMQHA